MTIKFTNNATTTLASGINSSATSLTVATGAGALFPSLSGSDVFYVTLANLTGTVEIVKVTARSSDTFTIVRAQDNTTAASWSTGDKVELRPTAGVLSAMAQTANNLSDLASPTTAANNLGLNPAGNGFKNRIINGAMTIDQRNAGASVTPSSGSSYTLDRWKNYNSQASKLSFQQNAGAVTPPAGFVNYLGATSLSAYSVGSSDEFDLYQLIEGLNISDLGWGTANAKTVTLSFWVRSSLTGTFGGTVANYGNSRNYPFSYTISAANTWEQKTITIAGDTSGTWLTTNGTGLSLLFSLGAGSTLLGAAGAWTGTATVGATGQVNLVGTNGATFYITGVQLEKGSTATSFDYRPYGTELALCQRYYYRRNFKGGNSSIMMAQAYSTSGLFGKFFELPVTMRAIPTASFSSFSHFSASAANSSLSTLTSGNLADTTADYVASGGMACGATLVAGNASNVVSISASGWIDASAEL